MSLLRSKAGRIARHARIVQSQYASTSGAQFLENSSEAMPDPFSRVRGKKTAAQTFRQNKVKQLPSLLNFAFLEGSNRWSQTRPGAFLAWVGFINSHAVLCIRCISIETPDTYGLFYLNLVCMLLACSCNGMMPGQFDLACKTLIYNNNASLRTSFRKFRLTNWRWPVHQYFSQNLHDSPKPYCVCSCMLRLGKAKICECFTYKGELCTTPKVDKI